MRGLGLLLIALLLPGPVRADPALGASTQMRDTGYVLGDFLEQHVEIRAPASARLARDSLPAPGRVNNWLELREVRIEDERHLVFTYQIFAAVEQALQLAIPPLKLRLRESGRELLLGVPAQSFYLSPVLPATLGEQDRQARVTPAPAPLSERAAQWQTLACAVLVLLIVLYLCWAHDRLRFLERHPGPMTRLFRELRRARTAGTGADAYREQLLAMHAAFNACARETLYQTTLPRLFERAPHLLPLRADIESFFLHSREVFYGSGPAEAWPADELLALGRRARDLERGLR